MKLTHRFFLVLVSLSCSIAFAVNEKNNAIQGVDAGGQKQTTVIDANGNLKIVNSDNGSMPSQPATNSVPNNMPTPVTPNPPPVNVSPPTAPAPLQGMPITPQSSP